MIDDDLRTMSRAAFDEALRRLADQSRLDQAKRREEQALEALRANRATHLLLHADVREIAAELVRDGLTPAEAAKVAAASIAARGAR